jgi:hypothetical protein
VQAGEFHHRHGPAGHQAQVFTLGRPRRRERADALVQAALVHLVLPSRPPQARVELVRCSGEHGVQPIRISRPEILPGQIVRSEVVDGRRCTGRALTPGELAAEHVLRDEDPYLAAAVAGAADVGQASFAVSDPKTLSQAWSMRIPPVHPSTIREERGRDCSAFEQLAGIYRKTGQWQLAVEALGKPPRAHQAGLNAGLAWCGGSELVVE